MAKRTEWIVTTTGKRPIADVVKELRGAGFEVKQVLEEIGSVTGSAEAKAVPRLRKIRGVADVSPDTAIDLGPPDSDVTW